MLMYFRLFILQFLLFFSVNTVLSQSLNQVDIEIVNNQFKPLPNLGVLLQEQSSADSIYAVTDKAGKVHFDIKGGGVWNLFVSGYLYVPQAQGIVGGGATHAWAQCYLPECGWFPVDPTNNLICGHDLIRVAVAREASEVAPLSGAWFGSPGDFAGMHVDVQVQIKP